MCGVVLLVDFFFTRYLAARLLAVILLRSPICCCCCMSEALTNKINTKQIKQHNKLIDNKRDNYGFDNINNQMSDILIIRNKTLVL